MKTSRAAALRIFRRQYRSVDLLIHELGYADASRLRNPRGKTLSFPFFSQLNFCYFSRSRFAAKNATFLQRFRATRGAYEGKHGGEGGIRTLG